MKKIYHPLIKASNWVLAGILSFLGFSGCNLLGKEEPVMYGVPWASCAIKGSVIDKATRQPVSDIEVRIALPEDMLQHVPDAVISHWTSRTDVNGNYKLPDTYQMDSIPVVATDIDGEKNGLYKPDTLYVSFKNAVHIGGGDGWFQGELVATANFELKTQETDE